MSNVENDEPTFFVSRRGRQVGVHQVDLSGIDIESSEDVKASKPVKTKATKSPKPPRVSNSAKGWTKKRLTIATALVVTLALPLLFGEFVTAQYGTGESAAEKDLQKLVSNTVLPVQKKTTVSADQIRDIATKVNAIVGHMCRGGLLDNAAGLYPRAKTALANCKESQAGYASLVASLYAFEGQVRYLERVDAVIKPVATPITDEYAVIGAQQTLWQTALEELKKLTPTESLRSAHGELLTHVEAASNAWSKLNTANNAQNATDFEAAEKTLNTEYEAIRSSSSNFSEVLAGTQATIVKNYSALK